MGVQHLALLPTHRESESMKPRVLVYKSLPADVLAALCERAHVERFDPAAFASVEARAAALADALAEADGAVGASVGITPAMLERAKRLRVLSTISVGIDHFDVPDLNRRG